MINTGKFNAELPRFEGTAEEKFAQLETFLYRLVENLRFAFSNVGFENLSKDLTEVIENKVDDNETAENIKANEVSTGNMSVTRTEGGEDGTIVFIYRQKYKEGNYIEAPGAVFTLYEGSADEEPSFWIATQGTGSNPRFNMNLYSIGRLILAAADGIDLPESNNIRVGGVALDEYIKSITNT